MDKNVDGKAIADEILALIPQGLTLGVVLNVQNPVSDSFVKMKERAAVRAGVEMRRFSPDQIEQALSCDGVLVQLPIDNAEVLIAQIPPEKDVDALGEHPLVLSPVAGAITEILERSSVSVNGKKAIVVGAGKLVGIPAAQLLRDMGADVTVVTHSQGSFADLKQADIVVCGAGEPGLIKPDMLKQGVVLIDAGTSEQAGKVSGDADPTCADVASVFTPVPGGVGPIAVAMLFKNLSILAQKKNPGQ